MGCLPALHTLTVRPGTLGHYVEVSKLAEMVRDGGFLTIEVAREGLVCEVVDDVFGTFNCGCSVIWVTSTACDNCGVVTRNGSAIV